MISTDAIKNVADIVEIVSEYTKLERKGATLWGLCPLHHEKTPSFSLSPEKGVFYCFGCGKGGDVITFIQEVEGVSFREAVTLLARRYGIDDDDDSANTDQKVLEEVWDYMRKRAMNEAAVAEFLSRRGVDTAEIGFDDGGWVKTVSDYDAAVRLGLAGVGKRRYSWFTGRIVFPVRSGGRLVGLTGRRLDNGERGGQKWFHSHFPRRNTVFLLDEKRRDIKDAGYVVVVEGTIDAIRLWQEGIPAVGIFGSSISDSQVSQVAALGVDVVLGLDRDSAGLNGTFKALSALRGRAVVRVAIWPANDPGDTATSELKHAVDRAVKPADFVYRYACWKYDDLDRRMRWLATWLTPISESDSLPTELRAIMEREGIVLPTPKSREVNRSKKVVKDVDSTQLLEADIAAVLLSVDDNEERARLADFVESGVLPEPGDLLVAVVRAARSVDPISVFQTIGAGGIFYRKIIEAPAYTPAEAWEKMPFLVRSLSIRQLETRMTKALQENDLEAAVDYATALEAVRRTRRV